MSSATTSARPRADGRPGATDWLAGARAWTAGVVVSAAVVGLVVCTIAVAFRTEIVPSDPYDYVRAARNFPTDRWVPLGYTRYGMILPLLPLLLFFGDSQVTYYFWPVVSSGVLAACLYLIGYRYWGPVFGVLAAVLGLVSQISFINLTRGYPDVLSTGIFALAVVLAFVVRDRLLAGRSAPWWLWLTIGLLLGWAFETRETTILTWPIIAVVLWTSRVRWQGLLTLAAGIGAWAVTDILIGFFGYGDALLRVHAFTRQDLATATNPGDVAAKSTYVGRDRLFYLGVVPTRLATAVPGGIWTLLLGVLALAGLAFRGGARFVALWFVVSYLTFVGITGGFFPDHPSGRIDVERYWLCFLPLVGLAAAGTTAEIAAKVRRRLEERRGAVHTASARRFVNVALAAAVALGPLISLTALVVREPQYAINGGDQLSQLRTHLAASQPGGRIVTDFATARLLPIYQRGPLGGDVLWTAEIVNLDKEPIPRSGDLVAINSLTSGACYFCWRRVGIWYAKYGPIPETWQVVWTSDPANLVLYRVP